MEDRKPKTEVRSQNEYVLVLVLVIVIENMHLKTQRPPWLWDFPLPWRAFFNHKPNAEISIVLVLVLDFALVSITMPSTMTMTNQIAA